MKCSKKLLAGIMTLIFCLSALSVGVLAQENEQYVSYVLEAGLMSEAGDGAFQPEKSADRAAVFQAFYSMSGEPDVSGDSFKDVTPEDWFAPAAAWAKETGLSSGTGVGFEGGKSATRAETAVAFYNYMKLEGINILHADNVSSYTDGDLVPAWAITGMSVTATAGVLTEKADATLDPYGTVTRGELAQMLYALSQLTSSEPADASEPATAPEPTATTASEPAETSETVAVASVASIDKYGNLTLDVLSQEMFDQGYEIGDILNVTVGDSIIEAPFGTAYSDVANGSVVIRSPEGAPERNVIVAINMGNFAETYGVQEGDPLAFEMNTKGGYLTEIEINRLERTNNREDYASDEIFANFRSPSVGDIAPGVLYRSSSPANNEMGRAAYANRLAQEHGVATVMNMADSPESLQEHFDAEDFDSPYYKKLYGDGQVIVLNMAIDFGAADFESQLKKGFEFILTNDGPYLVHCTEGKDRAGFAVAVLEALMGAEAEEIKEDYMLSFINYYHVEKGSEQYDRIADKNVYESLRSIAGLSKGAELEGVDLASAAEKYLERIGLTTEQIGELKLKLSTPLS